MSVLLFVVAGCARYRTFDLPLEPAHMRPDFVDRDGLAVAAELVVDPGSVQYHFGPDMIDGGYFPVFIHIENRGPNSFEVERKDFSVVLENGERFRPVPTQTVLSDIRRSPLNAGSILLVPLVVPFILVYRSTEEYNFELARSLYYKAMPSYLRLQEGDPPMCRALFFRKPGAASWTGEDFKSSVLEFVVEIEGSPPTHGEGERPGETERPRAVGRRIPYTVTLVREDVQ